jgi:hypothetical protein
MRSVWNTSSWVKNIHWKNVGSTIWSLTSSKRLMTARCYNLATVAQCNGLIVLSHQKARYHVLSAWAAADRHKTILVKTDTLNPQLV